MALIPTIQVCLNSSCDTLTLYETTGVYDASTNPGGYGTPNPDPDPSTQGATLTVIAPDETEYVINLSDNDFPNNNDEFSYELDMSELGDRTSIEDGYWQFIYSFSDSGTDYSVTQGYMFYCNSECCVAKILAKVEADECDCNEQNLSRIQEYMKVKTFLESLKNAARCFNVDKFNKIKTLVNKLCRNVNCKTCN